MGKLLERSKVKGKPPAHLLNPPLVDSCVVVSTIPKKLMCGKFQPDLLQTSRAGGTSVHWPSCRHHDGQVNCLERAKLLHENVDHAKSTLSRIASGAVAWSRPSLLQIGTGSKSFRATFGLIFWGGAHKSEERLAFCQIARGFYQQVV